MALGLSVDTVNAQLEATFCGIPFVVPQLYVQLHDGDPGTGGTNNIIPVDRQPVIFTLIADGVVSTAGSPLEFEIPTLTDDTTMTHISLHSALDGGEWVANLIANRPITIVEGDKLIGSDNITFTVTDWAA